MTIRTVAICCVQVPFTRGGAEALVENLRDAFVARGYDAEIVAVPFKWYPPKQIIRNVLAWRMLDLTEAMGRPIDLVVATRFPAYCVDHPRKVVWLMHQHRAAYELWGTEFCDLSKHADGDQVRDLIHSCDNRFLPQARAIFTLSREVTERLRRYNAILSEPLYHLPPNAADIREGDFGDAVFYPSRLDLAKRQDLLIEAMRHVKTDARCVIAGAGPTADHLADLVRRYRLDGRVTLTGFISDEERIARMADAFAVPFLPYGEDYGYVTLEAMLAGKPVITLEDAGGPLEFVTHGEDGLVVPPDPKALAAAIDDLYRNRDRAREMGRRGRDKLGALDLSWDHVVDVLVDAAVARSADFRSLP